VKEHRQIEELLAVYDDLSAAQRRQVEQHIRDCETCAARLAAYRTMDRELAALASPQPDERLREGFYAMLEGQSHLRQWLTRVRDGLAHLSTLERQQRMGYAFMLSSCVLVLLVVFEAAHLLRTYRTVQRAAREATRWAVTYQPERGYDLDGSRLDESEEAYLARRTRLIKQVAVDEAGGLDIDQERLGLDPGSRQAYQTSPDFFGIEVWGFPSFEGPPQQNHPSLPGLPVLVRVTHNTELDNPLFRAVVPQVQFTAQAEMINEGTQAGFGNVAPPTIPSLSLSTAIAQANDSPHNYASWATTLGGSQTLSTPDSRLILKSATLDLQVDDADRTLDEMTQTVNDLQGYIINQRVWHDGENKRATITLAVPAQEFESTLRGLRDLAARVVHEEISGEDTTDQYVDLEARLRNLKATRDRVRGFLDQAQSVEEALQVNRELSALEEQIEQAQSRLNSLRQRVSFATITVNLTPTPPPPPPDHWRPGDMAQKAANALVSVGQTLVDALVWSIIALGPVFVVAYLLIWGLGKLVRRRQHKTPPLTGRVVDESETK
jgi:hypothetical protein